MFFIGAFSMLFFLWLFTGAVAVGRSMKPAWWAQLCRRLTPRIVSEHHLGYLPGRKPKQPERVQKGQHSIVCAMVADPTKPCNCGAERKNWPLTRSRTPWAGKAGLKG